MSLRRLGLLLALPTVVGISLSACGTEDDAAPGPVAGSGMTAGAGGTGETGGTGANAGKGGTDGLAGEGGDGPGPGGAAGSGGDGAGGEGGQAPVACHLDLFKFDSDPGGSMGKYLTPATGPVQSSTVSWNSVEGVTAPGSGKLIATFGALGEQAQLSLYTTPGPLACHTKLHAKVKLVSATDLSTINGIGLSISSGPFDSTGRYSAQFTSTSSFAMDTWYSIELPFATASYQSPANTLPDFTDVRGFGIQVQTKTTGATPVETTLYVDDVWVE